MEILNTAESKKIAASRLSEILQLHNDKPVLLLLSGGSWFEALDMVEVFSLENRVVIGMCDERFSVDSSINNFAQLTKTNFYKKVFELGANFIDTRVQEGESLTGLAQRFETALRDWKRENPTGVVVVTLGMGADGHTAGLFAGFANYLPELPVWVIGYEVPQEINEFTKRVTVTPEFLITEVAEAVVLVLGTGKCPVLSRVLNSSTALEELPAVLWQKMKSVLVVTDCR